MPINNPTSISEYYDPASRRIKESIESGISVPVLIIGDSSTTATTYWAAAAMKKLGEQLVCNVKHRAYVHATTDYEGWSYPNAAGQAMMTDCAYRYFMGLPSR